MKKRILLLVFLSFQFSAFSQLTSSLFIEIAGSGGFGSINYEQQIVRNTKNKNFLRVGFSLAPIDKANGTIFIFPLMYHYVRGQKNHHLDFGIGQSISFTTKGKAFLLMPVCIGYRFQNPDKKYFFRASYTPLLSFLYKWQLQQWGGISFGYVFKK